MVQQVNCNKIYYVKMKILNDPMIRLLVDTFDLETPEQNILEICDYEYKDGAIVIKKIKVLDSDLNFIRFADLEKVTKYLSKYYCNFNDRATDTDEDNQEA